MKTLIIVLLLSSMPAKVFITENGSRYHLYQNCRSLKSSVLRTIDIKEVGKKTICLICKHRFETKKEK